MNNRGKPFYPRASKLPNKQFVNANTCARSWGAGSRGNRGNRGNGVVQHNILICFHQFSFQKLPSYIKDLVENVQIINFIIFRLVAQLSGFSTFAFFVRTSFQTSLFLSRNGFVYKISAFKRQQQQQLPVVAEVTKIRLVAPRRDERASATTAC